MSLINDVTIDAFIRDVFKHIGTLDRLLDLGCGTKPYERYYSTITRQAIAADSSCRGAPSVQLSATALPFRNSIFDAVLLSEVLEHIDDPFAAIEEIARVLRPGGHLILTVPFIYHQHEIPHDHFRFTQFGLVSLLQRNGLQVVRLEQRGSLISVMIAECEFIVSGVYLSLRRIPLLGIVLGPFGHLARAVWRLFVNTFYSTAAPRNIHIASGSDGSPLSISRLKGRYGQLRLWTLGYCVVAVKERQE